MQKKEPLEGLLANHLDANAGIFEPLAEQAMHHGTDAFREVVPKTAVMTPVAAAQEPPAYIERTLGQYARQMQSRRIQPFSVVLSMNYPEVDSAEYSARIKENRETVEAFMQSPQGSQLPLSYIETSYPPETTIGKIRRDLGGVSLRHLQGQYARTKTAIPESAGVFISDIDTWSYSRECMARLQHTLDEGYSWAVANKRYLPTGTFPQIDRCIRVLNLVMAHGPYSSYDCHSMYNLRALLAGESFSEDDSIFETHEMRERAIQALGKDFVGPLPRQIPGAIATSYPRRPEEQIRMGALGFQFWKRGEFTMQDSYREGRPLTPQEDVSEKTANRFIGDQVSLFRGKAVRDAIATELLAENGDLMYAEAREIADDHVARVLRIANVLLELRLQDISILDGVQ